MSAEEGESGEGRRNKWTRMIENKLQGGRMRRLIHKNTCFDEWPPDCRARVRYIIYYQLQREKEKKK